MWMCDESYYMDNETSHNEPVQDKTTMKWWSIFTMVICAVGIVGNCFNVVVLLIKCNMRKLQPLEFNANITLLALALSDLLFCALVFPHPLTDGFSYYYTLGDLWVIYYRYYGHAMVNLFLMSSTYMIVILAVERYIVMYYPLRAKLVLYKGTTTCVILLMFFLCICATLPYFFNKVVVECTSAGGETLYELLHRWDYNSVTHKALTAYITYIWPSLAVFLPLSLLFFCNIKLIYGMQRVHLLRQKSCPGQRVKAINHQITVILIIIIFVAIILLMPADVVKLINPFETWGEAGYIVADVVNAMQSVNFSFNFLLYCVMDKSFYRILFPSHLCKAREKPSDIECKDIAAAKEPLQQSSTKVKSTQKSTLYKQIS